MLSVAPVAIIVWARPWITPPIHWNVSETVTDALASIPWVPLLGGPSVPRSGPARVRFAMVAGELNVASPLIVTGDENVIGTFMIIVPKSFTAPSNVGTEFYVVVS